MFAHPSAVATAVAVAVLAAPAAAGDPWADLVHDYVAGSDPGPDPGYTDPATALGPPERFSGEGVFPGVVSPFQSAFGVDEIVSIGAGGALVVEFAEPVTDDPANPFGIDLLVFGNAGFIDAAYPNAIVDGLFGADGGTIAVSDDGVTWHDVGGGADGLYPTLGYLDAGPYDTVPGTLPADATKPVDPAFAFPDLAGMTFADILDLYDGAAGGRGVDLADVGLASVRFVRVSNPVGAAAALEIDAFADVAPAAGPDGDVDGDGAIGFADLLAVLTAWGPCPGCPADVNGDGAVGFDDLLVVLTQWSAGP